jgi:hypothetical protein
VSTPGLEDITIPNLSEKLQMPSFMLIGGVAKNLSGACKKLENSLDYRSKLSVQTLAVWDRRRNWRPRGITACRNIE